MAVIMTLSLILYIASALVVLSLYISPMLEMGVYNKHTFSDLSLGDWTMLIFPLVNLLSAITLLYQIFKAPSMFKTRRLKYILEWVLFLGGLAIILCLMIYALIFRC